MKHFIIFFITLCLTLKLSHAETTDGIYDKKDDNKALFLNMVKECVKNKSFSLKYSYSDTENNRYDGTFAICRDTMFYTMGKDFIVWQQGDAIYSYTPSKQRVEIDHVNNDDISSNYLMLLSDPNKLLKEKITIELYEKRGSLHIFHFKNNESADRIIIYFKTDNNKTYRINIERLVVERSDGEQSDMEITDFKNEVKNIEKNFTFSPRKNKKIKYVDFRK